MLLITRPKQEFLYNLVLPSFYFYYIMAYINHDNIFALIKDMEKEGNLFNIRIEDIVGEVVQVGAVPVPQGEKTLPITGRKDILSVVM